MAAGRPDLPLVATGGRYDALTEALGGPVPAVGGVARPGVLASLEAA
jgi:ATP phosphoribosyltransferase regulatory subunit